MSVFLRMIRPLMFGLMAGALTGCGGVSDMPDVGRVEGRITIEGEPLSGVMVVYSPETGRPAAGVTDKDGRYVLEYNDTTQGTKLGPNTISFAVPTGGSASHPIPARYQHNSPLKADVQKGKNTFDFELEPDKPSGKKPRKPVPAAD